MNTPDFAPVEAREAAFWNEVARRYRDEDLMVVPEGKADDDRLRLQLLAPLEGKRVLDVGCGTGEWSTRLALHGAEAWAVDISPESVAVAERAAALHGVADRVRGVVGSAYALPFDDGFFDAVHGANIIHHLDATRFGTEIARVLRPGGVAVFSENSSNNTLLMFARDHVCGRFGIPKWSSDDEYPLSRENVAAFGQAFASTEVHYPDFLFLNLVNMKVFKYRSKVANAVFGGLDRAIKRYVPAARPYSYRQLVAVRR